LPFRGFDGPDQKSDIGHRAHRKAINTYDGM
jgi:hypothetical protein